MLLGMLPAVQFNNQFCFETNEVRNVVADGVLPLELVAAQPTVADHPPKLLFRLGRHVAHRARE
ncbi:MAG TPA: hypothetical protein VMF67_15215 [Rhizomicrobium sp.]|nr:hypothetical protein [Rhizomicrobium sp.]